MQMHGVGACFMLYWTAEGRIGMYTFDSRVRYSETDENGELTPLAMINYLQDCSTFQSENLGVGIAWLREWKRAWLLNSWKILIDRTPLMGEPIQIGTFAHGFKGIYGYRHFFIKDAAGAFCVRADSIWFLCNTETMTPVKAEEEFTAPYLNADGIDLGMDEIKRKLRLPEGLRLLGKMPVMRHHLDTNHHVNNAQYVNIALEAAGICRPSEIQAEYRRAAVLGDELFIFSGPDGAGGTAVSICSGDQKPYAIIKFPNAAE